MILVRYTLAIIFLFSSIMTSIAGELRMAVTTSFHNSGLSDILLPAIEEDLSIRIQLIVVGTGQALKLGRSGDVDALLVHSKAAEETFVSEGYAPHRRKIMYNDFVIIGPRSDSANVRNSKTVAASLQSIKNTSATFVSRGDDSGTHRKEQSLWLNAGMDANRLNPSWYKSVGSGMGAALNIASGMNAYILSDRASWLKFKNKGELELLFSGDPALFNQYAYLPIDPEKHPHVQYKLADQVEQWLVGEKGQKMIADYTIGGEKLFIPNAQPN